MTTAAPSTRKRRVTPKPHAMQENYYAARALFELCAEQVERTIAARGYTVTDDMEGEEQVLALYERQEDVKDELRYYKCRDALRLAEEQMVAWAIDHVAAYSPAHAAEIRAMVERAKVSVVYWPKVVDSCARLRA